MNTVMHWGPTLGTIFMASLVEFVEALTIVLAVVATRGWRVALAGAAAALAALAAMLAALGPTLLRLPLAPMQFVVGLLTLLFGMRWLIKACLRAAGVLAPSDEAARYARHADALQAAGRKGRLARHDLEGFLVSFQGVAIEGLEVVFIVLAVGTAGLTPGLAFLAAVAALLVVVAAGGILHRPLTRLPENTLKLVVAVTLCALGTCWTGEGMGLDWPGDDGAVLWLAACFLALAAAGTGLARGAARPPTGQQTPRRSRSGRRRLPALVRKLSTLLTGDWRVALAVLGWVGVIRGLQTPVHAGTWVALGLPAGLGVIMLLALFMQARSGGH